MAIENPDYRTVTRALHFLDKWEEDPYSWGVERIYNMIPPMRKLFELVKASIEIGRDSSQYEGQLEIAKRVVAVADSIINGRET